VRTLPHTVGRSLTSSPAPQVDADFQTIPFSSLAVQDGETLLVKLLYRPETASLAFMAVLGLSEVLYESINSRKLGRRLEKSLGERAEGVTVGIGEREEALRAEAVEELLRAVTDGTASAQVEREGFEVRSSFLLFCPSYVAVSIDQPQTAQLIPPSIRPSSTSSSQPSPPLSPSWPTPSTANPPLSFLPTSSAHCSGSPPPSSAFFATPQPTKTRCTPSWRMRSTRRARSRERMKDGRRSGSCG
jgi:hypothetical protein